MSIPKFFRDIDVLKRFFTTLLIGLWTLIAWNLLIPSVPQTPYWRDSAEFILTGFALDVGHPPGYPLLSQLTNIAVLLPMGPIAFRANSFAALILSALLVSTAALVFRVGKNLCSHSVLSSALASLIAVLILLSSGFVLKQGLVIEAYGLNALLMVLFLHAFLSYTLSRDVRWFFVAGFLVGLGSGNHITFIFQLPILVVASFLECWQRKAKITLLVGSIVFFFVGLALYCYVPVRAFQNPPLNTGEATTIERLWHHATNKRREISELLATESSSGHEKEAEERRQKVNFLTTLGGDLEKFSEEIPLEVAAIGVLGFFLLVFKAPLFGLTMGSSYTAHYLFFRGWPADPWIFLFTLLAISVSYVFLLVAKAFAGFAPISLAALLGMLLVIHSPFQSIPERTLKGYSQLEDNSRTVLSRSGERSTFISEQSWFAMKYLREIEGYRDDLTLVYLHSVLFPEYFVPARLETFAGDVYDSRALSDAPKRLKTFLDYVTTYSPVFIEPSGFLGGYLRPVLQQAEDGSSSIHFGESGKTAAGYQGAQLAYFKRWRKELLTEWRPFRIDSRYYFNAELLSVAMQLQQLGLSAQAAKLIVDVCEPLQDRVCDTAPLNNVAVYLIEQERYETAKEWLLQLKTLTGTKRWEVDRNLAVVERRLSGGGDSLKEELQ